jgi:hypothetical protein
MHTASNPADVNVEMLHFLKCDLKDIFILVGALAAAGIIVIFNWIPAAIVAGLGIAVVIFSFFHTRQLFSVGDVCPALVIDPKRNLIAVGTDLSKTGDPVPAVKVLKQPLGRVTGGPFEKHTRLAFVAMYNGFPHEKRWRGFGGYLVNSGTTNEKTIRRVLKSIDQQQWEQLEAALEQLDKPYRPGLYDDVEV